VVSTEKITAAHVAFKVIKQLWKSDMDIYESAYAIFLNRNNVPIGWMRISQGGISGTVMDPKLIAKNAIQSLASGVIIAHNHPSGNLTPSHADHEATKKIAHCLRMADTKLLDHLILAGDSFVSFQDEGWMPMIG
jgi:DNA repair protein RadC